MDLFRIAAKVASRTIARVSVGGGGDMTNSYKGSWTEIMGPTLEAWKAASGPLIDEIAGELKKHDIEEMESDRDYEMAIVEAVVEAYQGWEFDEKLDFNGLPIDQRMKIADIGLNETKYGSYRGNLPDAAVVRACLLGESSDEDDSEDGSDDDVDQAIEAELAKGLGDEYDEYISAYVDNTEAAEISYDGFMEYVDAYDGKR